MLDGNIAYFAQHTFTSNSPAEVTAVLQEFVEQGAQGIIWDLRSNGGGSMEAAQANISAFIEEGLLFQIELKGGEIRQIEATGEALAGDIPLVILVSGTTFSAAETAAASIQEHGRGVLIGDTTYGKGTVQTTLPMPEGTAVQFTIAHWLSPNGEWFDGRGVEPDIKVIDNPETSEDEVLSSAIEWLLENRE
jgi:carboxyl-terminal processing protease